MRVIFVESRVFMVSRFYFRVIISEVRIASMIVMIMVIVSGIMKCWLIVVGLN